MFTVFRAISSAKFELLYTKIVPLLPGILEMLSRLQVSVNSQNQKELFVELALTVPVRLTHILTCLPLMLQPIRMALESNTELAHYGLRLLETCCDSLDRAYFDPIFEPVKADIILALWRHAKPPPHPHGEIAAKVLGKLAGRDRDFAVFPERIEFYDVGEVHKVSELKRSHTRTISISVFEYLYLIYLFLYHSLSLFFFLSFLFLDTSFFVAILAHI